MNKKEEKKFIKVDLDLLYSIYEVAEEEALTAVKYNDKPRYIFFRGIVYIVRRILEDKKC